MHNERRDEVMARNNATHTYTYVHERLDSTIHLHSHGIYMHDSQSYVCVCEREHEPSARTCAHAHTHTHTYTRSRGRICAQMSGAHLHARLNFMCIAFHSTPTHPAHLHTFFTHLHTHSMHVTHHTPPPETDVFPSAPSSASAAAHSPS